MKETFEVNLILANEVSDINIHLGIYIDNEIV